MPYFLHPPLGEIVWHYAIPPCPRPYLAAVGGWGYDAGRGGTLRERPLSAAAIAALIGREGRNGRRSVRHQLSQPAAGGKAIRVEGGWRRGKSRHPKQRSRCGLPEQGTASWIDTGPTVSATMSNAMCGGPLLEEGTPDRLVVNRREVAAVGIDVPQSVVRRPHVHTRIRRDASFFEVAQSWSSLKHYKTFTAHAYADHGIIARPYVERVMLPIRRSADAARRQWSRHS